MIAGLPIDFSLEDVPFPTELGEWTLCLSEDLKDFVWIENRLILAFAEEFSGNFVDTFRELGHVVFKWLRNPPAPITAESRQVWRLQVANSKIDFRIGFWSQKFVLLPRPALERTN